MITGDCWALFYFETANDDKMSLMSDFSKSPRTDTVHLERLFWSAYLVCVSTHWELIQRSSENSGNIFLDSQITYSYCLLKKRFYVTVVHSLEKPPIKRKCQLVMAGLLTSSVKQQTGGSARAHAHGNVRNAAISSFAGKQKELLERQASPTSRNKDGAPSSVFIVLTQSAQAGPLTGSNGGS